MKKIFLNNLFIVNLTLILLCFCASFSEIMAQDSQETVIKARIKALTSGIAAAPKNDRLYVERGQAHYELREFDLAQKDAEKALQINPKNKAAVELKDNAEFQDFWKIDTSLFGTFEEDVKKVEKPAIAPASGTKPVNQTSADNVIVPGKGARKIVLGAKLSEIEAILGKPEKFVDDSNFDETLEYSYFSKGIRVIFSSKMKVATGVLFTGETAGSSFKDFKIYNGKTDLGIIWGSTAAEIIKLYGKPVKEQFKFYPGGQSKHEWLRYKSVEFGFREGKLFYISNDPIFGK